MIKFPVFYPVSREPRSRDEFAPDSLLRQRVRISVNSEAACEKRRIFAAVCDVLGT
jgi:hypothetical protein